MSPGELKCDKRSVMSSIFSNFYHVTSISLRFNRRTFYFNCDHHRYTAISAAGHQETAIITGHQETTIIAGETAIIAGHQETTIIAGETAIIAG